MVTSILGLQWRLVRRTRKWLFILRQGVAFTWRKPGLDQIVLSLYYGEQGNQTTEIAEKTRTLPLFVLEWGRQIRYVSMLLKVIDLW